MNTILIKPIPVSIPPDDNRPRIRITRDIYYRLYEANLIPERTELMDGEILVKMFNGPARLPITREMYHFLSQENLISEKTELIDGEILEKMSQGQPHQFSWEQVQDLLIRIFGRDYVRAQGPISLTDQSEPEPDVFVTLNTRRHYLSIGTPPASEIRLAVEVSDSTLRYDLTVKAALYANANVPEYWVIDLTERRLIVHRDPTTDGYQTVTTLDETGSVSPLAAPQSNLSVADLLP